MALICRCLAGSGVALAAGQFDGTYTGAFTLLPGGNWGCATLVVKMAISDNKLTYVHSGQAHPYAVASRRTDGVTPGPDTIVFVTVTADVSADGSFHGHALRPSS